VLSVISVVFCFVTVISPERLNGFAPNLQRRRVWSLAGTGLNVKGQGQGHQGQKNCCVIPIDNV